MIKRRSSGAIMLFLSMLVLLSSVMVHAKTYVVGDGYGWTFTISDWPNGKSFKAGDVLEFNYDPSEHNVVKVSKEDYDSCSASDGSPEFQSGDDKIKLDSGMSYFICTFPSHCISGMKIAVNVSSTV